MDDEVKRHLFESLFTTKELGKGTGLGLATCYGIIGQHNGVIAAISEVDRGTAMQVYLPQTFDDTEHLITLPADNTILEGNESILLVEDGMRLSRTLVRMFTQNGYEVTSTSNGEEALRIVNKTGLEKFDLMVTDVVMPRMGGSELVNRVHELNPSMRDCICPVIPIQILLLKTSMSTDANLSRNHSLQTLSSVKSAHCLIMSPIPIPVLHDRSFRSLRTTRISRIIQKLFVLGSISQ